MAKTLKEEKIDEVVKIVKTILRGDSEKTTELMKYFKLSYPVEGMSKLEIALTHSRDKEIIDFLEKVIAKMKFEVSVLESEAQKRREMGSINE